jgi:hypothetical protein
VLWKLIVQVIAEPPLGDGRKMKRIREQSEKGLTVSDVQSTNPETHWNGY